MLLGHVQNLLQLSVNKWQQGDISIEFERQLKNTSVKWAPEIGCGDLTPLRNVSRIFMVYFQRKVINAFLAYRDQEEARWVRDTLSPRQNGRHFPDDIFKCTFLNDIMLISIDISLKFVPEGPINNIPALVQIMAWRWLGDKPVSEAMMFSSLTDVYVTRPQWVNQLIGPWKMWQ